MMRATPTADCYRFSVMTAVIQLLKFHSEWSSADRTGNLFNSDEMSPKANFKTLRYALPNI